MRNKKFVYTMMKSGNPIDIKTHRNWFKTKLNRKDFLIIYKKTNKIIGLINCKFTKIYNQECAELGKYIGNKYYLNKGIASEATIEWINYIFSSTNISYFYSITKKNNKSNIAVNKKMGFKIEKIHPKGMTSDWISMKLDRRTWLNNNLTSIRNIYHSDLLTIFKWRNHYSIRNVSENKSLIPYSNHLKWYKRLQENNLLHSYLITINSQLAGTVNFKKINNKISHWSIYKKPKMKTGTGTIIAYISLNKYFSEFKVNKIYAVIIASNKISIKFHESLGFKLFKIDKNNIKNIYELSRNNWNLINNAIKYKISKKYKS